MINKEEWYLSKCLAEMSRVYERNTKNKKTELVKKTYFLKHYYCDHDEWVSWIANEQTAVGRSHFLLPSFFFTASFHLNGSGTARLLHQPNGGGFVWSALGPWDHGILAAQRFPWCFFLGIPSRTNGYTEGMYVCIYIYMCHSLYVYLHALIYKCICIYMLYRSMLFYVHINAWLS